MEKKLNLDRISKIVEFSEKGMYRPEIAEKVGVSESTVFKCQKIYHLI